MERLRCKWGTGQRIAQATGLSRATVCRVLVRQKLSRMRDLQPPVEVQRLEHAARGDLLHLDIKRLVRIARPSHRFTGDRRDRVSGIGAEFVHVAIDDHSRIAFSAIYPNETRASVLHLVDIALAPFTRLGIHVRAVLTDNPGSQRTCSLGRQWGELPLLCLRRPLPRAWAQAPPYASLHAMHQPQAERFIQTAVREQAYARTYQNSAERKQHLAPWIHQYSWHRPHASLGLSPPISRSGRHRNNLLRLHI